MNEQPLIDLYAMFTGHAPVNIVRIKGSGSNRHYYRIGDNPSVIGVIGENVQENEAFIYLSNHFKDAGINVPRIFAVSDDRICYLQEDLGHVSLFDLITENAGTDAVMPMLEKTIMSLPRLQWGGVKNLDASKCYPVPAMDHRAIMWDLNYFKYCFLKISGVDFKEDLLENDFEVLAEKILSFGCDTFMYRDFQSRNVMVKDGQPWFIDYQGGRKGPYHYDVVSFLWQARAGFSSEVRLHLIDKYIEAARAYIYINASDFARELRYFVLFRTIQVLGAYGFRGLIEHKEHFMKSIPKALRNLKELLEGGFDEFPYLVTVLSKLTAMPQFSCGEESPVLELRISSFGYKRHGIPADLSGNGGGFVFDCRAIHNPGRYDEYKTLTGRDRKVKEFLEHEGSVLTFLQNVYGLVEPAVKTYLERGFTHLMVSFGCTGGQHRSVYCAEALTSRIRDLFPQVRIVLNHLEQNIEEILEPRS